MGTSGNRSKKSLPTLNIASGWLLCGLMALALIEGQTEGQCVEHKLITSDGAADDFFGTSVSISGSPGHEVAIVGAYGDDDFGEISGSAYIYRFNGVNWVREQKLLASDATADDFFGFSVSISGTPGNEIAIVSAHRNSDNGINSGSVYIYRFNGVNWVEEQKILASDGTARDFFGQSVSISGTHEGEVAIVAAAWDDIRGTNSGAAYIYRFDGKSWVEEQKIFPSDRSTYDLFGSSVSISGVPGNEVAIVGAFRDSDNGRWSGSAYIFRFNGVKWVEEQKLLASDATADDFYGFSVSISGTTENEIAIVGAYRNTDNGISSGSAYIYRFNGANWVEEAKLLASDGTAQDMFGKSVSIKSTSENEVAIVGAYRNTYNGISSGSAYIYRFNGVNWVEENILLASDRAAQDRFGSSVSINEDIVIVGAQTDDDTGVDSGSAYIIELMCGPACPGDLNNDDFVNVADLLLLIGVRGSCPGCPPPPRGRRSFSVTELLELIAAWGPCPAS